MLASRSAQPSYPASPTGFSLYEARNVGYGTSTDYAQHGQSELFHVGIHYSISHLDGNSR